jgi:hypothetical protein
VKVPATPGFPQKQNAFQILMASKVNKENVSSSISDKVDTPSIQPTKEEIKPKKMLIEKVEELAKPQFKQIAKQPLAEYGPLNYLEVR